MLLPPPASPSASPCLHVTLRESGAAHSGHEQHQRPPDESHSSCAHLQPQPADALPGVVRTHQRRRRCSVDVAVLAADVPEPEGVQEPLGRQCPRHWPRRLLLEPATPRPVLVLRHHRPRHSGTHTPSLLLVFRLTSLLSGLRAPLLLLPLAELVRDVDANDGRIFGRISVPGSGWLAGAAGAQRSTGGWVRGDRRGVCACVRAEGGPANHILIVNELTIAIISIYVCGIIVHIIMTMIRRGIGGRVINCL